MDLLILKLTKFCILVNLYKYESPLTMFLTNKLFILSPQKHIHVKNFCILLHLLLLFLFSYLFSITTISFKENWNKYIYVEIRFHISSSLYMWNTRCRRVHVNSQANSLHNSKWIIKRLIRQVIIRLLRRLIIWLTKRLTS